MKQYWSEGELVEFWTLTDVERQLSDQRTPRGRLGLAVLLKFFQFEDRFPYYHKEVGAIGGIKSLNQDNLFTIK